MLRISLRRPVCICTHRSSPGPGTHPLCWGATCGLRLLCWGLRVGPTLSLDLVHPQDQRAPESAGGSQPWLHVRTTRDSWKILAPHPLPLSPLQRVGTRWSWKRPALLGFALNPQVALRSGREGPAGAKCPLESGGPGDTHRFLPALTSWRASWEVSALPALQSPASLPCPVFECDAHDLLSPGLRAWVSASMASPTSFLVKKRKCTSAESL